jgi:hypothetical protein
MRHVAADVRNRTGTYAGEHHFLKFRSASRVGRFGRRTARGWMGGSVGMGLGMSKKPAKTGDLGPEL